MNYSIHICKRLTISFMCFFTLFVITGAANAQNKQTYLDFEEQIESIVASDDTFIVLSGGALWTYEPNDIKPTVPDRWETNVHVEQILISNTETVLALSTSATTYDIYEIVLDKEELCLVYQISKSNVPTGHIRRALWQNEQIILEYQNASPNKSDMLIYDTQSQTVSVLYDRDLSNLLPYSDEMLLGLHQQNNHENGYSIVTYNMITEEISEMKLLSTRPETFYYDRNNQQIVVFVSPYVNLLPLSNDMVKEIYVPVVADAFEGRCCAVNSKHFLALSDDERLQIINLDEESDRNALKITRFNPEGSETKRFRLAHPEVPVVSIDMGYQLTPAVVSQFIRSNDTDTDIYMVRTFEAGYSALLEKGFCSSLTNNEDICSSIGKMPGNVSSALFYNEELLAVPVEIEFDAWTALTCNKATLNEIGIADHDIPTNMLDLLDVLISWYEDGTLYGIRLFDTSASRQPFLITWFLFNNYTYTTLVDSNTLNFDTPLFHDLIKKCDLLCSILMEHTELTDTSSFLFRCASPATFLMNGSDTDSIFIPITPSDGMNECYPAYLTVAILNPLSKNKATGELYLASILRDLPIETQLFFWPELVQPQEREGYQDDYQFSINEIKRLQALLDGNKIEESQRAEILTFLEDTKQWLEFLERDGRWALSAETIESYKQFADSVFIAPSLVRELFDEPMLDTIQQYANRQIDIHALIDRIERKTRLMQME